MADIEYGDVLFVNSRQNSSMNKHSSPEPEKPTYEVTGKFELKTDLESAWEKVEQVFHGTKWPVGKFDKHNIGEIEDEDEDLPDVNVMDLIERLTELRTVTNSITLLEKTKTRNYKVYPTEGAKDDARYIKLKSDKKTEIRGIVRVAVVLEQMYLITKDEWELKVQMKMMEQAHGHPSYKKPTKIARMTAERRVAKEIIDKLDPAKHNMAQELVDSQVNQEFKAWVVKRLEYQQRALAKMAESEKPQQTKPPKRK